MHASCGVVEVLLCDHVVLVILRCVKTKKKASKKCAKPTKRLGKGC